MRPFLVLALSAAVLFAAGSAWLALYPPVPADLGGARDLDARAERVSLPVAGGGRIEGWLLGGPRDVLVIFLHGYARDHHRAWRYAQFLRRDGYSILAVDFRSSAARDRRPTTLGYYELEDARAALDWARRQPRFARARIALFGESLGGSVALALAAERPDVAAVVADCPFANGRLALEDALKHEWHLPAWPLADAARLTARLVTGHDLWALDAAAALGRLEGRPVLLIQSGREDRFGAGQVALLESAAGTTAEGWTLPDCGHNQAWLRHRAEYEARVRTFYGALFGGLQFEPMPDAPPGHVPRGGPR